VTRTSRGRLAPPSRLVNRVLVGLEVVKARSRVAPGWTRGVTSTDTSWSAVWRPDEPTTAPTAGALAWVRVRSDQLPVAVRTSNPMRLAVSACSRRVARWIGPASGTSNRMKLRTTGAPSTRSDGPVPALAVGASARVVASAAAARVWVEKPAALASSWLVGGCSRSASSSVDRMAGPAVKSPARNPIR
jgi:hypothetical protein